MRGLLLVLILLIGFSAKGQEFGEPRCDLILKAVFKKSKIKVCDKTLDVEIADNDGLRAIGLMCRDKLAENDGMVFVFPEEKTLSFWMKNTRIPLSVGYFDKNKTLVDIYDMEPMNENKVYASSKFSMYAIETNQGWYKKNNIKPGCKFEFLSRQQSN